MDPQSRASTSRASLEESRSVQEPGPGTRLKGRSATTYRSINPCYDYDDCLKQTQEADAGLPKTKWFGIFLAFLSGTSFTISAALVKSVQNVDPMVVLSLRCIFQIVIMSTIAKWKSKELFGPKEFRFLVQLQGIVGGMTLTLLYYSFRRLPLGDATTIIFSSPVIVIILSAVFLKEPCGLLRCIVIFALISGVVLVAQPPFIFENLRLVSYDVMGYVCALLAAFFTAFNLVVMRKCASIHFSVIVLSLSIWTVITSMSFFGVRRAILNAAGQSGDYFSDLFNDTGSPMDALSSTTTTTTTGTTIVSTTISSTTSTTAIPLVIPDEVTNATSIDSLEPIGLVEAPDIFPSDWYSWQMILLVSFFGLVGQVLVAKALKIEGAGKVSVTRSLDIILAYVIQTYLFGDTPSATSIVGVLLILFSVFCIGFEKEIYDIFYFVHRERNIVRFSIKIPRSILQ